MRGHSTTELQAARLTVAPSPMHKQHALTTYRQWCSQRNTNCDNSRRKGPNVRDTIVRHTALIVCDHSTHSQVRTLTT